MKIKNCNNTEIKKLLKDKSPVMNSILTEFDFDDNQLKIIKKYNSLKTYQQDILYLSSVIPIAKLAELYCCSKTSIYNMLKKIKRILQ